MPASESPSRYAICRPANSWRARFARGLAYPQAVRLSMASDVPAEVRARVARVAEDIVSGRIHVPEAYDGPEFATPA